MPISRFGEVDRAPKKRSSFEREHQVVIEVESNESMFITIKCKLRLYRGRASSYCRL